MDLFNGICTAFITPFRNGETDFSCLEKLINIGLDSGIAAVSVCGTTGEAPTLTDREKHKITRLAKDVVNGRVPVIRGVGSPDTAVAVKEAVRAERDGADALLALTPYYNKCTRAGAIAHFGAIADAVKIPIIIYNVPSRTGVDILPDTVLEIKSGHPNVMGIKEAGGNVLRISELATIDGLYVYGGDDATALPTLACGGHGIISVVSNITPKGTVALYNAVKSGNLTLAKGIADKLSPVIKALFAEVNPIPVKHACAYLGLTNSAELRLPLTECSKKTALEKALSDYGFVQDGGSL